MKRSLAVWFVAAVLSLSAAAQGRGSGGNRPALPNLPPAADRSRPALPPVLPQPADPRRLPADPPPVLDDEQKRGRDAAPDAGLPAGASREEQTRVGAYQMLERKTGHSREELQAMFETSGARNFGQFVAAMVVAKNLDLDIDAMLEGLQTRSLGQVLQDQGLDRERADAEIRKAQKEIKQAAREQRARSRLEPPAPPAPPADLPH